MLVDLTGHTDFAETGRVLYQEIIGIASGKQTKAEISNYGNFPNIFTIGPII
jgi:altronate dehydratase